jgi:MFS family permease
VVIAPQPLTAGAGEPPETPATALTDPPQRPLSAGHIVWMMVANFGSSIALMVPLSYALAVRIDDLAPGHEELLGYVTGVAQIVYIVLSPMIGLWSDRTRSRLGRRTPFLLLGAVLGLLALARVALAPGSSGWPGGPRSAVRSRTSRPTSSPSSSAGACPR